MARIATVQAVEADSRFGKSQPCALWRSWWRWLSTRLLRFCLFIERALIVSEDLGHTQIQFSSQARWFIGICVTVAIALIGVQVSHARYIGTKLQQIDFVNRDIDTVAANLEEITQTLKDLNATVTSLIRTDIKELETRMRVMEAREILPGAAERISANQSMIKDLESRIRALEQKAAMQ